jgi:DNA-binding NtrC family response regulator
VRELRNLMERLVLMTAATEILPEHLPSHIVGGGESPRTGRPAPPILFPEGELLSLEEIERAAIDHTLERVGGNKTKAAEVLGISRQTLRTKLRDE